MTENEKLEKTGTEQGESAESYIEAMAQMKENYEKNYVSREEFDKKSKENAMLLNALTSGKKIDTPNKPKQATIQELRNDLWGKDCGKLNSVEYISKMVELRDRLIEAGERDPAITVGNQTDTTALTYERAEAVATALKDMLEFAEGDEGIFLAQYQRMVTDPKIPVGKRK